MTLESGPAKADRNWQLVRTILFLGFAVYFFVDGAIRYPAQCRSKAQVALQGSPYYGKIAYESLSEDDREALFAQLQQMKPTKREQVRAVLGDPTLTTAEGTTTDEYYVDRYGAGKVSYGPGGRLADFATWKPWEYTKKHIKEQFYWALVPLLPGLYFAWRLYKAITLRVTLDDEGMLYDQQRIAFANMVALKDYSPKGWIDLYYKAGDQEKKLRLDNEKVLLFDEIVAAICAAKHFPNEVTAYAAEKARRKADEEAAAAAEEKGDAQGPDER